jgi:hypothetical protein
MEPVLRCADFEALIAEIALHEEWRGLADARPQNAAAVLAAPAAVARGIALFAPQLAQRSALSILVIGAESTDAPDQGRWYQAVAVMLGSALRIDVTLVGSELDQTFSSALADVAPAVAAVGVRAPLVDFLSIQADVKFDVAVMFQPGFQKYRGWLDASGLARLLEAGTLLLGGSYSTDEYEMERWVLECHGYRASEVCQDNPFYLELGDRQSVIRWGGVLWQVTAAPTGPWPPDAARLQSLELLNRMVLHSMTAAGGASPPLGTMVELSAAKGRQISLIHIFDRRFVDPATAVWYRLDDDGLLHKGGQLPPDEIAAYPRQSPRDIERALWAAAVKAQYLMADYPEPAASADTAAHAGGMFNALRVRAAQLFR